MPSPTRIGAPAGMMAMWTIVAVSTTSITISG